MTNELLSLASRICFSVLTGALCVALWGSSAATAQNDWTVISTAGDPDPITSFDLANPVGSQMTLGFVDGNFNRGIDYFAEDSFYYFVSTDALNDVGDRGLWAWVSGMNMQLGTIDFSDSGDGDATWDAAANRFLVTVNDGDATAGDSLYMWDNLDTTPTFTEIGEIGLDQFIGIAIDPTDGTLYGYDSGTESLYSIDTATGAPTLIGASGLALAAIGGMDFSSDGQTLVLVAADDLFLVDKLTGMLTPAGQTTGLNCSALAYNVFDGDILLGDVNGDGEVNLLDVAPFVAAVTTGTLIPEADINQDGSVDLLDVAPFVALITGG